MVTVLENGTRKARKHHQCFECYRMIAQGERYGYQSNVYDGRPYSLRWHIDCGECGSEYRALTGYNYDEEGYPPLRDEWVESGEYESECNLWRGKFPHVVARMELTDQIREPRP